MLSILRCFLSTKMNRSYFRTVMANNARINARRTIGKFAIRIGLYIGSGFIPFSQPEKERKGLGITVIDCRVHKTHIVPLAHIHSYGRAKISFLRWVWCSISKWLVFVLRQSPSSTTLVQYSTQEYSSWLMNRAISLTAPGQRVKTRESMGRESRKLGERRREGTYHTVVCKLSRLSVLLGG